MKMVLIERQGIHIEDASGQSVGFLDLTDLQRYTGFYLSEVGTNQVTYEPERNIHDWFDGINSVTHDIPNGDFETLISNVALYKERKDNPYYDITVDQAKLVKNGEIESMMGNFGSQVINYDGHDYYADRANIDPTYAVASNKFIEGDTTWSVRWTTADKDVNGVSIKVVHTAATFKLFAEALYTRNEAYFQVAADHKDNVAVLTTVEDIENYDITTGW